MLPVSARRDRKHTVFEGVILRYRSLGQSEINVSVVGLGTWAIGGWSWGGTDETAAIDAIAEALDRGINLIDTAPMYGQGVAEKLVGRAIAGRRNSVVLATKCGLVWHVKKGNLFFTIPDGEVHRYLGPESIRHEVEQSLSRLGTDYIDLYQTHWQDPTTPIEETMAELLKLKDEGKIRAIGASNASVSDLAQYRAAGQLDTDQEQFSMIDRAAESEQLPYCREHGIAFLAYSPLALGLLTGKATADREFPEGDLRHDNPRFSIENRKRIASMIDEFRPIAESKGISIPQLVIAWTVAQPGVTHALVGARNPKQAEENAAAGDVVLSDAEITLISGAVEKYLAAQP